MEMEFTVIHSTPTTTAKLVVLSCLFWPFVAASLMSQRGKSASPVAAALVSLAVSGAGAWLGLVRTLEGVAITGGGTHSAAAGIAESLRMFFVGGCFALVVIVFAALRRHRPIVDRMTATLVAVLIVDVIGALFAAAMVSTRAVGFPVLIAGAIVAGVVAAVAIVWTFLTGRGRVSSSALPHGVTVVAILLAVIGVIVWELAHGYAAFAMSG